MEGREFFAALEKKKCGVFLFSLFGSFSLEAALRRGGRRSNGTRFRHGKLKF
jgi:hypothetical protein